MVKKTPQQATSDWIEGLENAETQIKRGVLAVTESPMTKAVAKQDLLLKNFTASIKSGKWARNTSAVTLQQWQKKFIDKGIPNISVGARAAESKMIAAYTQLFTHIDAGVAKIKALPDLTLNERIARAVAMMKHMAQYGGAEVL